MAFLIAAFECVSTGVLLLQQPSHGSHDGGVVNWTTEFQ